MTKHAASILSDVRRLQGVRKTMVSRCYRPCFVGYEIYGGAGVTVCPEWRHSSAAFVAWALAHGYAKGLTIDRIDSAGPYSPENCRWVDRFVQNRNRSICVQVEFEGRTMCIAEWADHLGADYFALQKRLKKGWPVGKALTEPFRHFQRRSQNA